MRSALSIVALLLSASLGLGGALHAPRCSGSVCEDACADEDCAGQDEETGPNDGSPALAASHDEPAPCAPGCQNGCPCCATLSGTPAVWPELAWNGMSLRPISHGTAHRWSVGLPMVRERDVVPRPTRA